MKKEINYLDSRTPKERKEDAELECKTTTNEQTLEIEQLRVQLAGCSVAALGGTKDIAKQGDYGWSPTYQDVLDLRLKYDKLNEEKEKNK